ncbi:hypothetical protein A3A93_00300 [Candidatus Roizmanbacteria bacterium RIFCSPLOWO2_01_FULL_38_12]|uniref:Uncharacterized protein n=1 Tax=Candidatus Roizmanbacteria bacterium RIFCSPLOWO2_01_FULL_38_12 TaxID=1802061 RepID=A0A1F7IUF1_9BACT|nr:MAG: hypothetical protein A2861_00865 [Candidatus Roizmanbacteria bacterium RIFCSPHIGHO2_01_FULL_38_15]OGK34706.1 MAG: hypothetical protein A3F59_01120 [Candidatus Roizmanbacteria bacterium RIFCSPHIGHO2_12_FULL_38_13]OGK46982.1 MAG: hypothetical protein A3A93_00300 [Candidatus Roizmanbacteria bacterium RIFCSPLOWO2_01_FULL_38_12]
MPKTAVSAKSTKQEILTAYEQLTKELAERDGESMQLITSKEKKDAEKVTSQTPNQVVSRLGGLRLEINKNLGEIVDRLVEESEKLHILKDESDKIRKEIELMHKIKVQATTLQNFITIKEEEELTLEKKMNGIREEWEAEKIELQKQKKREEEEYTYDLKIKRQKEEDEYREKRKQIETALQKREQDILEKEEEFKNLQTQVTTLEKQLEIKVVQAIKKTDESVRHELETEYNLERKGIEGEQKIRQLTISNLQKIITNQNEEIKDLKQQLQRATQQIKDIAVSVIETKKPIMNVTTTKSE